MYDKHCKQKDSQYFCEYGANGICCMWREKNFNEPDYKIHVRDHAFHDVMPYRKTSESKQPTDEWNFYSASQCLATVLNDPRRPRSVSFNKYKISKKI